jgi:hypothetical protein
MREGGVHHKSWPHRSPTVRALSILNMRRSAQGAACALTVAQVEDRSRRRSWVSLTVCWWGFEGGVDGGRWGFVAASPEVCCWRDRGWRGPLPKAPRGLCASSSLPAAPEGAGIVLGGRGGSTWCGTRQRKKTLLPLRRPTGRASAHRARGASGRGPSNPGRANNRPRGRRLQNPTNLPPQPPSIHHRRLRRAGGVGRVGCGRERGGAWEL